MSRFQKASVATTRFNRSAQLTSIEPIALDVKAAANYLSTTPGQIRSLTYSRQLHPFKLGKKLLYTVESLQAFVKKMAEGA